MKRLSGFLVIDRFLVGFLVGFLLVALASFLRLGRLFCLLGRRFCGLGWRLRVLFFCSFVLWLVPPLRFLPRSPRRLPSFVRSGGLACSVGSRWRFRVSRCRPGFARRSASPPRVPASPLGCVAVSAALGGSAGRSLLPVLLRWVCRSARVAFPLAVSSCRFFRNFF